MKKIAVYCGSSPGSDPAYTLAAKNLGKVLADRKITLVYGGGSVGLMGVLARAVLANHGKAIGVIPRAIAEMEVALLELNDLRVVDDMHSRKSLIADLSDAFIALPGGVGTIEELLEILTWAGLGFHTKPVGLLNVNGFFDPLLAFLDQLIREEFIAPEQRAMLLVDQAPEGLLSQFHTYQPPSFDKAQRAKANSASSE